MLPEPGVTQPGVTQPGAAQPDTPGARCCRNPVLPELGAAGAVGAPGLRQQRAGSAGAGRDALRAPGMQDAGREGWRERRASRRGGSEPGPGRGMAVLAPLGREGRVGTGAVLPGGLRSRCGAGDAAGAAGTGDGNGDGARSGMRREGCGSG